VNDDEGIAGATLSGVRSRWIRLAAVAVALVVAEPAAAGTLSFDRVLPGRFEVAECTEGGAQARCFIVENEGLVPGLGLTKLRERVLQSGDMDDNMCEPQVRYGTISTPRGTIDYLAGGIDCPATREQSAGYRAVVVSWRTVGGTGAYAGVTGSGHAGVRPEEDEVFTHIFGALEVPGLEFDTTAPVLSRVPRRVTIRADRLTAVRLPLPFARDAVDGVLPVKCAPPAGGRYRFGATIVECEAVDKSGNAATARFTVVVAKRKR
jgi:hypothetical protein